MRSSMLLAVCVILFWGVTFASTRVLLEDFSALEIQAIRFGLAWFVLWLVGGRTMPSFRTSRDEPLFAGMGLTGVALYQFLESCAIYYTNASNVAILVSFGLVVTAVFGSKGSATVFLNTENCLIFASAEGEDSERMRGCGG